MGDVCRAGSPLPDGAGGSDVILICVMAGFREDAWLGVERAGKEKPKRSVVRSDCPSEVTEWPSPYGSPVEREGVVNVKLGGGHVNSDFELDVGCLTPTALINHLLEG